MIYIYPIDHFKTFPLEKITKANIAENYLWGKRPYFFLKNAKSAIHLLALTYQLKRTDEVAIFTTSNSNFVSTCVSATLFNYCAISRELSERTKMIYVIHEFGQPYQNMTALIKFAKEHNIPLIEDCAHALDSTINGQRIGTFGNYAIYSLAKHLPMVEGGLLVGENISLCDDWYKQEIAERIEKEFHRLLWLLPALSKLRKQNFISLRNNFPHLPVVFEYHQEVTPYFLIFITKKYAELYDNFDEKIVQLGRVHVKQWLAIPTQPLMTLDEQVILKNMLHDNL